MEMKDFLEMLGKEEGPRERGARKAAKDSMRKLGEGVREAERCFMNKAMDAGISPVVAADVLKKIAEIGLMVKDHVTICEGVGLLLQSTGAQLIELHRVALEQDAHIQAAAEADKAEREARRRGPGEQEVSA